MGTGEEQKQLAAKSLLRVREGGRGGGWIVAEQGMSALKLGCRLLRQRFCESG